MLHLAPGLDLPCMRVMRRNEQIVEEAKRIVSRGMLQPRLQPPRTQNITQVITAPPSASAPLDSPPDSPTWERVYDSGTIHLFESDGEDYSSAEVVEASTKDLGGC